MKLLKRIEILEKINLLSGRFFTVEFTKQNGQNRVMNCRTGVTKHLSKNGKKIKLTPPSENGILRVYDLQSKGYRSINLDTIKKINYNKITLKY
jgi:hypothetical protein